MQGFNLDLCETKAEKEAICSRPELIGSQRWTDWSDRFLEENHIQRKHTNRQQPHSREPHALGGSERPLSPVLRQALAALVLCELGCGGLFYSRDWTFLRGFSAQDVYTQAELWLKGGHIADTYWGWASPLLPAATAGATILLGEVSEASVQKPDTITVWIMGNSGLRSSWAEAIYREIIPIQGSW